MPDAGLFVGWGAPVRGREQKGLEVFNEALQFNAKLREEGRIESFEVVLLGPHGGDLYGYILTRGSLQQIDELRNSDDFLAINTRAGLIVERLGVVDAALGEGLGRVVGAYQQAVTELGG
jgi:hypothetical protein